MLTAVKGYYDGNQVVVDENDKQILNSGDRVVITILNRNLVRHTESLADKRRRLIEEEKFVHRDGRTAEDIDGYLREMRANDRI